MATLCIKGIPEHVHLKLKQRALANRRSLNREVVLLLEMAAAEGAQTRADAQEILELALASRKRCKGALSVDELREARQTGRE
jgi:plasmid stability protein